MVAMAAALQAQSHLIKPSLRRGAEQRGREREIVEGGREEGKEEGKPGVGGGGESERCREGD